MSAETDYILTEYVSVQPGQPYRLFPFGIIWKGGRKRELTPDIARTFRLPHFKPPIKLGSHDDTTPSGGQILSLEVREDSNCQDCKGRTCKVHGLFALPELTDKGTKALVDGDYRYHSPEVIWEGFLEDPNSGNMISGPLIVGDALLHTPHLGEAAALYTFETKEVTMPDEQTVQVPKTLWEKVEAFIVRMFVEQPEPEPAAEPEPTPEPEPAAPVIDLDQMSAVQTERDNYKAQLEAMQAETDRKAKLDQFSAALAETKAENKPEMLSSMTPEQAEWVLHQFKALTAQIDESALTAEVGSTGEGAPADPKAALDVAIRARMGEKKADYNTALAELAVEKPELFRAAYS